MELLGERPEEPAPKPEIRPADLDREGRTESQPRHSESSGDILSDANQEAPKPGDQFVQAKASANSQKKPPSPDEQRTNRERAEKLLQDPNVRALLDVIAEAEKGAYNILYGEKTFDDFTKFPGKVPDKTKGEKGSSASGRYQITIGTHKDLSDALGLSDFSPKTQDLMAVHFLDTLGALKALESGRLETAVGLAAKRWNALPLGPGMSNRVGGQPYTDYGTIETRYNKYRQQQR